MNHMHIRWILISSALITLCAIGFASDGYEVVPIERNHHNPGSIGPTVANHVDAEDIPLFIHRRYINSANYYLRSGAEGDTFATYFKTLASCSLHVFAEEFYSPGEGTAFIWAPNPAWLAAFPTGRSVKNDEQYISPLGEVLAGPIPFTVPEWSWVTVMSDEQLNVFLGNPDDEEIPDGQADWRNGFLAGWVKGGDFPQPLADDVSPRGFNFTWFGGPRTMNEISGDVQWGWYNQNIENMVDVGVAYPWGTPPIVQGVTPVANTVDQFLHVMIDAEVFDDDGWTPVDEYAWLHRLFLRPDPGLDMMTVLDHDSVLMTEKADGSGLLEAEITLEGRSPRVGDRVEYWVNALDNTGSFYSGEAERLGFNYHYRNSPFAHVLWIDDGSYDLDGEVRLHFSRIISGNSDPYLDVVEVYDLQHNGDLFDPGLLREYWTLVLITGDGTDIVPLKSGRYSDYFDRFRQSYTKFIYIDQDYAFAHYGEDSTVVHLEEGDFAYDIFGITSIANNPPDADSNFYGPGMYSYNIGYYPQETFYVEPDYLWRAQQDYFTVADEQTSYITGIHDERTYCVKTQTPGGNTAYYLGYNLEDALDTQGDPIGEGYSALAIAELLTNEAGIGFVSVDETPGGQPQRWSLDPAWPNPFNPNTRVSFSVPEAGRVILEVFDITGRRVTTLQNDVVSAGQHTATFDGKNLASGTYLVRLRGEGFSATRRIVLLK